MPYITREDGERFVIPSYRDILSAKKESLLKKEVVLLSQSYGDYLVLQRRNADQFEVSFSPDAGYLLGETVWHHFKRPRNMIYCEAIPNTSDVILVIVKAGSVYLDGSFPLDSIPEELVIFKTQQISFDVFIHGDVPISQKPEPGKFVFDTDSIKSFNVLEKQVFPVLPLNKTYQLRLVDDVLKSYGIGIFPIQKILGLIILLGLGWMGWVYLSTHKQELPQVMIGAVNPYQPYINALTTPDPTNEISRLANNITLLFTIPGWMPDAITYSDGKMLALMLSQGARTNTLFHWVAMNHVATEITNKGIFIREEMPLLNRLSPTKIYSLKDVVANLIDRLSYIIPGNSLKLGSVVDKGKYKDVEMVISFDSISTITLDLIGQQLRLLPFVLEKVELKNTKGYLSGTINLKAAGN